MGHRITGLIARRETLYLLGDKFPGQPYFDLEKGLGFLPLDDENLDDIVGLHPGQAVGKFTYLTEHLLEYLREASRSGGLVYVETGYFGGTGGQGAAVFRDSKNVFGPEWHERGVINDALSVVDIAGDSDQIDPFAAIGLAKHRSNTDFRALGAASMPEQGISTFRVVDARRPKPGDPDPFDLVLLPWADRQRPERVLVCVHEDRLLLDLPVGTELPQDTRLILADGRNVQVIAAEERLTEVTAPDLAACRRRLDRLGIPTQSEPKRLVIPRDDAIESELQALGAVLRRVSEPFEPDPAM